MTIPQWVLLGFAGWTLLVLSGPIGLYRWAKIFAGHAHVNEWRADGMQGADWYRRAMRAHANCVENLPVYAGIVVCGTAAQATAPLLDVLAVTLLAARICQTSTHVAFEQTDRVVAVRFSFFFVQMLCMFAMGILVAISASLDNG
jgi:uncharacterized MAPEG superfamily protein